MNAVTPDGVELHYEVRGEGPPLVLIMGFGMPGHVWGDIAVKLAADHRVLTLDNRGIGGSSLPDAPYTMGDLADDVAFLMDEVGFEAAHVTGVSMGGMIAQELALRHRERVASLTLIATHTGGPGVDIRAVLPTPRGLVRLAQSRIGPASFRARGMAGLLYPKHTGITETLSTKQMVDNAGNPKHAAAVRQQLRAVFGHHTTDRIHQLAGLPTVVVRPGMDRLCRPSNNDRLAAAIPGAQLVRIDDAGHGIIAQCVDELVDVIRNRAR